MTQPPLAQILRSLNSLPPFEKAKRLRTMIANEQKRSIRRRELEAALFDVVFKQMRRENRQDRRMSI